MEVLGHLPNEVNMSRLASGTAALLVNHDWNDVVGVIERASIDGDRKGRADVRFGQSARASEVFQDVKDRIRLNVSVGYFVNRIQLITAGKDGEPSTYRVIDWEPYEISIVSIPADIHAGIGRSETRQRPLVILDQAPLTTPPLNQPQQRGISMNTIVTQTDPNPVNLDAVRSEALITERKRVNAINDMAARHAKTLPEVQDMARRHIEGGQDINDFSVAVLDAIAARDSKAVQKVDCDPKIGLSDREADSFSICRAIESVIAGDRRIAPFEMDVIDATRLKYAGIKKFQGEIQIPSDVLLRQRAVSRERATRTMLAGGSGVGAELVGTFHDAANFIDLLRAEMLATKLGVRVISGLVGNVAIPKMTSGVTAYWISEGGEPAESNPGTGQVVLQPRTIAAYVDLSRKLIQQSSPDAESLVREEMAMRLALGIDLAIFSGSGASGQPTGITETTGVGAVAISGAITWANLVALESAVATANALIGSTHYVTTPALRGTMKTTLKAAGVSGWLWEDGEVNGYAAHASNQAPAAKVIFGNFGDVLVGEWGGLDINVDTSTLSKSGGVRLVTMQDADVAIRNPQSFAVAA
jgi:HK97 family phage major capsid protein/HK97 family phage prohead protease